MTDQTQNMRELIDMLEAPESVKQDLKGKLEASGPSEALLGEIEVHLGHMDQALRDQYPQEVKDLPAAEAEFNAAMDKIQQNGEAFEKTLHADLDAIDAEEIRKQLQ